MDNLTEKEIKDFEKDLERATEIMSLFANESKESREARWAQMRKDEENGVKGKNNYLSFDNIKNQDSQIDELTDEQMTFIMSELSK